MSPASYLGLSKAGLGVAPTARPGVDLQTLFSHVRESGTVVGAPGTEEIANEERLELDVLVPAARDRCINETT